MTKRIAAKLDTLLDRKLFAYAAAAGAAGVGMLALVEPSKAEIVYTPTHEVMKNGVTISLDLNGDGITDFTLLVFHGCNVTCRAANFPTGTGSSFGTDFVKGAQLHNQVVIAATYLSLFASNLKPGAVIGAGENFGSRKSAYLLQCEYYPFASCFGGWQRTGARGVSGYVGVEFSINGETHYGWVRVSIRHDKARSTGLLSGYAYETVAGMPIRAGQTSGTYESTEYDRPPVGTLGSLALGAKK